MSRRIILLAATLPVVAAGILVQPTDVTYPGHVGQLEFATDAAEVQSTSSGAAKNPVAEPVFATPGWAGYVVRTDSGPFANVHADWVQPKVVCNRPESSVAFWIGLGGATEQSEALEQIGTSADCSDRALPSSSAWYQLFPAPAVELPLKIRPGDRVAAEVAVSGWVVTLRLRDLSTKAAFSTQLTMWSPETDSAEWIVEAPSACPTLATCTQLPLADFVRVRFTEASTASGTYHGTVGDRAWSTERVLMSATRARRAAVPSSLSADGSSFSVVCPKPMR
jgi:hypothetical protein